MSSNEGAGAPDPDCQERKFEFGGRYYTALEFLFKKATELPRDHQRLIERCKFIIEAETANMNLSRQTIEQQKEIMNFLFWIQSLTRALSDTAKADFEKRMANTAD